MNLRYRTWNENEEKADAGVEELGAANYSQCVLLCEKLWGRVFFSLWRIIDISMEELCLKFDLKDSYSSWLVLVIDLRRQNHFHTWFDFCCFMLLSLHLQGFQSRRTRKWNQRWDFVDWQFASHCLSNERKFHMHWSHLNIFLGIIEHITPKKPYDP